jgi:translation initiation factor IF-1
MAIKGKQDQDKELKVNVDGKVVTVLPGTKYRVQIEIQGIKHELTAYPSGKIRKNYIKLQEGDLVVVEMSPEYDINNGRIVWKKGLRQETPLSLQPAAQPVAA